MVGDLVSHLVGEWSSARRYWGTVVAVREDQQSALVFFPHYKHEELRWHNIDDWHVKNFWKVIR